MSQKLEEALRLLKDYGDLSFASTEELFMAQCTPAEDELHMMAVCLAYFKVCINGGRVLARWYGCVCSSCRQVCRVGWVWVVCGDSRFC